MGEEEHIQEGLDRLKGVPVDPAMFISGKSTPIFSSYSVSILITPVMLSKVSSLESIAWNNSETIKKISQKMPMAIVSPQTHQNVW